jgi:putative transposase
MDGAAPDGEDDRCRRIFGKQPIQGCRVRSPRSPVPPGWRFPHELPRYETVRAWLDSAELPMPMKVLAREGERRHNESCAPYLRRGYTDVAPNQIWVSDHMIHDVWVRNDCFAGIDEDAPMRLRLTCLLDMRSRKVPGYCWTPEGSSRSIATALRIAISRFGAPASFYVDNGKDYQRVARGADPTWKRTSTNSQYLEDVEWVKRGILYRLGIDVQHCIKYHPQSKHIERFFRTLHMRFDSLFAHYTTGNAYAGRTKPISPWPSTRSYCGPAEE